LLEELPELEGLPRVHRDEDPDVGLPDEDPDVGLPDEDPDVGLRNDDPDVGLRDEVFDLELEAIILVLSISNGNVWPLTLTSTTPLSLSIFSTSP
jgi:hypothetical protein